MRNDEIIKIVEAILFVSGEPIDILTLSEVLLVDEQLLKDVMEKYIEKIDADNRGIKIIRLQNRYQMTTNEKYFNYVEKIYKKKALPKLTESALETLAIVAFKQPISKNDISRIRGVNSDYNINKLLEYNIICEVGRADTPGRPLLFGTTDEFLKYYGIASVEEFAEVNQLKIEDIELDEEDQIQINLLAFDNKSTEETKEQEK